MSPLLAAPTADPETWARSARSREHAVRRAGPGRARASVRRRRPGHALAVGLLGRRARTSPGSPRSLSVGPRNSSSRGPSTGTPYSSAAGPVAASNTAGPRRSLRRRRSGSRRRRPAPGRAGRGRGVQANWARATTCPASAHGGVGGQLGGTVSQVSPSRRAEQLLRQLDGDRAARPGPTAIGRSSPRPSRPSCSQRATKRRCAVSASGSGCGRQRSRRQRRRSPAALTAANSASPGVGGSSGSTMPSITKLPSCTTSPKSPP